MTRGKWARFGNVDCYIICPNGPPPACPMVACARKFGKFAEDIGRPKKKITKKKKSKGGKPG